MTSLTTSTHPAVAPVVAALAQLREYAPTDLEDLAAVLRSLNDASLPSVFSELFELLHALGARQQELVGRPCVEPDYEFTPAAVLLHEVAYTVSEAGFRIDKARTLLGQAPQ